MVDLQAEQEAGYMVTIISQKKDFFFVRFDYPNIGQFWIKKGDIVGRLSYGKDIQQVFSSFTLNPASPARYSVFWRLATLSSFQL